LKILNNEKKLNGNLKLNKILISLKKLDKYLFKLCDYGILKEIINTKSNINTSLTMAPGIINDENDLSKCNLWSIGIIIYFMYFKEYPYYGKNDYLLYQNI